MKLRLYIQLFDAIVAECSKQPLEVDAAVATIRELIRNAPVPTTPCVDLDNWGVAMPVDKMNAEEKEQNLKFVRREFENRLSNTTADYNRILRLCSEESLYSRSPSVRSEAVEEWSEEMVMDRGRRRDHLLDGITEGPPPTTSGTLGNEARSAMETW